MAASHLTSTISTVTAVTALMLTAMGFYQLSQTMSTIDSRIAHLESQSRTAPAAPHQATASRATAQPADSSAIADLTAQLDALKRQIHSTNNTAADGSAAAAQQTPNNNPVAEKPAGTLLADGFIQRGYVYENDWETMSQQLTSLTAEQNKQFWGRINSALATGKLEVFDNTATP